MPTVQELEAQVQNGLAEANAKQQAKQSEHSGIIPPVCSIPPYPAGATEEQKIAALRCALDMIEAYLECLDLPYNQIAQCVSNTCSTFQTCWNNAFGIV